MKNRGYFVLVFIYVTSLVYSQKCTPKFPLKDGWLGGDGNVSVSINEDTTYFFFSDTFVGKKNQQTRLEKGLKMVSNSVAIHTCLPNGETNIKYFWNDMYSKNPKPIFKTKKKKYKFWIVDAFKVSNDLYVLLEKIGPKKNAPPDDIFNFSSVGYNLVKITNIYDIPTDWNMVWIPMDDFNNPAMGLRCHVILNDYIFFYVNRHDKEQVLVRKNINLIDSLNIPFEYYAKNNTWKEGLNYDDMKIVVDGFRSNTVKYHPDLKQWVMILDIWFMDNKIKMRTSPLLTGPWSEEKTIFEIPQMTPGNKSFAKNNFCYLPRECIQNYDSENHVMLITYDVNNSNLSEVLKNPEIYTPKVITVLLKK
jgi:hypothetical protein